MDIKQPEKKLPTNQHKKDLWLQILLPVLLLAVAALAFLIYLIIARGNGGQFATTWSQIAVIWLILPALVAGILIFVLLLFLSRVLRKAHGWLPPKFHLIGNSVDLLNNSIAKFAEKTTSPVIGFRAKTTGIKVLFSLIRHKKQNSSEEG